MADQERVRVEGRPKLGKLVLVANCCKAGGRGLGKDGLDGGRSSRGGCWIGGSEVICGFDVVDIRGVPMARIQVTKSKLLAGLVAVPRGGRLPMR